ncbi:hypothetical protein [Paenibacillus glycinis]|uniref:Uncharacterized protein n=1 Tax=Paenibacillus glycinis TaxID=2697035 RepID=A0ABW9Y0H7_9BACL|nr:hypothetical protein [Paenibacillus glycinis]NBD28384.1 hypothetical protein [Paenibacillus glycinis]
MTKSNSLAWEENRKQTAFVQAYIQEHFGADPDDIIQAQSDALEAYWKSLGFEFGQDQESFILPEGLDKKES